MTRKILPASDWQAKVGMYIHVLLLLLQLMQYFNIGLFSWFNICHALVVTPPFYQYSVKSKKSRGVVR